MSDLPHTIGGVVQSYSDDSAIIALDTEDTITIPKAMLSDETPVGGSVHIAVFSDSDVATEHERIAKAVLAEMLRG